MPRKPQGLRPISESVRKIIEKIKKEREERQKQSSSPRTQPKLPGLNKGGMSEVEKHKASMKGILDTYDDVNTPMKIDRLEEKLRTGMEKIKKEKSRRPDSRKPKKSKGKGFERKFPGPARPGNPVEVYEVKKGGLIGGQKKLDANKDGQISGEDFKILKAKKNKMKGGGIAIRGTNFKGVY